MFATAENIGKTMNELPSVSVVIPAHNEEVNIANCLQSLQSQDYSGPWEIIVVDNASTDNTAKEAETLGVRVISCPTKGVVFAREAGLRASLSDIILQTDADCIFPPDWVRRMSQRLAQDPRVVAVAGEVHYRDEPLWHSLFAVPGRALKRGWFLLRRRPLMISAANFAVRREALKAIAGYDCRFPNIGDEGPLLERLWREGKVMYDPSIVIETSSRKFKGRFFQAVFLDLFARTIYPLVVYHLHTYALGVQEHVGRSRKQVAPWIAASAAALALIIGGVLLYGYMVPTSSLFGKVYSQVRTNEKVVALTFDDGPSPSATPKILDILERNDVRATFFLQGEDVKQSADLVLRIAEHGHEVGNHMWTHRALAGPATYKRELTATQKAILETTGATPAVFRPPYGRKTPWLLHEAKRQGLSTIGWSVSANDPKGPAPKVIAHRVITKARPGSIILLHDGAGGAPATRDRTNTVEALPIIIETLKAEGYHFATVSELLAAAPNKRRP